MSFEDIFQSEFLENMSSISLLDMSFAMILSLCMGLFIFYIYKKSYCGVMYSASFGVSLIAMTLITTLLIITVISNVVLSLGMVGALSIVRFRTAIKEPMDIVFLFWSIADGIVLAAGLIPLAVFGSLFIGLVLLFFASNRIVVTPYILLIHCDDAACEKAARELIQSRVKRLSLKSKSVQSDYIELNYEIRLINDDSDFVNELHNLKGISHVTLVSYQGDYMG